MTSTATAQTPAQTVRSSSPVRYEKTLSANDLGVGGSHQSGILVPKTSALLRALPALDESAPNPRAQLRARCSGSERDLTLVHYNSRILGSGSRDEYRLTGASVLLRKAGAKPGDRAALVLSDDGLWKISVIRAKAAAAA